MRRSNIDTDSHEPLARSPGTAAPPPAARLDSESRPQRRGQLAFALTALSLGLLLLGSGCKIIRPILEKVGLASRSHASTNAFGDSLPQSATNTSVVPMLPNTNVAPLLPGDRLNEGDVIQVSFPGATNLNAVVTIPPNGSIRLPFSTNLQAAGLTLDQLRESILDSYESQLQLRELTLKLLSSSSAVYVSGAVLRPGRVQIVRPLTALEAVMEAGGFDPNRAKRDRVTVVRYEGGKQVTFRLDLKRALEGKKAEPFYLKPFDILYVPSKTFNF